MCGRFAFYSPSEATAALFGVDASLPVEARYNIAPSQYIAGIREAEDRHRELAMLKWSFRAAYRHRRCLVLADGFYEWHRGGDTKVPYYISLASGEPFAFAGLWESWTAKDSGTSIESAALITTAANPGHCKRLRAA